MIKIVHIMENRKNFQIFIDNHKWSQISKLINIYFDNIMHLFGQWKFTKKVKFFLNLQIERKNL